jgi:L-ascorbate metabolism protein UlaG (beta-lactamase superfamily)
MEIQLIRNATIKLRYEGATFLIDPFFADKFTLPSFSGKSKNPVTDLPFSIEEIMEGVDFVLVSHLHPDHFDIKARKLLPRDIKIFCQPSDLKEIQSAGFTDVVSIQDEILIGETVVRRTGGKHGRGDVLKVMGNVSGFVFKGKEEKTLYWTGDTVWCHEVRNAIDSYKPEVIVCHAGANQFIEEFNVFGDYFRGDSGAVIMDVNDVLKICECMPESKIIATHIGALDHDTLTRESLRKHTLAGGISEDRLLIPEDGDIVEA